MPGINNNTTLMLHGNGTDGSTNITDDSPSSHGNGTITGTVEIDTAQSKFGGASILFNNASFVSYADSTDWDWGTNDLTIDCWVRFPSFGSNNTICARVSGASSYMYLTFEGTTLRFRDFNGTNNIDMSRSFASISNDTWHHIAVIRTGSTFRMFLDGVQQGADYTNSNAFIDRSVAMDIGHMSQNGSYHFDGWIDELRIQNGEAVWTAGFTPPTEEYSSGETVNVDEYLSLTENVTTQTNPAILDVDEYISLAENIANQTNPSFIDVDEYISLTENVQIPVIANFATKIISYNPLVFVTDTDPANIVKVDTTDPENPIFTKTALVGATNAQDVVRNSVTGFIYIACANGIVVKVDENDFNSQTLIDLNDTDELLSIDAIDNNGFIYVSSDQTIGDLYTIDERTTAELDSRLDVIFYKNVFGDISFNAIQAGSMDSDFNALSYTRQTIECNFKCLTNQLNNIEPLGRKDFKVFIDNVELLSGDLILESIVINHSIDQKSQASFRLTRKHDRLDYDLDGNNVQITNQNAVKITINDVIEFEGNVAEIDCQYGINEDSISVTATAPEPSYSFNNLLLSLPSLDEPLGLYDILLQNPKISNPVIDPNDDNPQRYKGIRVSLGEKREQSYSRYTVFDNNGTDAEAIETGTFNPKQNWTYFWSPTVRKFGDFELGSTRQQTFFYIGTSLSPVSNDLWSLVNALHRRQRRYDDIVTKLGDGTVQASDFDDIVDDTSALISNLKLVGYLDGSNNITSAFKATETWEDINIPYSDTEKAQIYEVIENNLGYEVGQAPFLLISTRNGQFIPKPHWADEPNGLYEITEAGYNFIDYAKTVADLEYQKLQNINGSVTPITSASITLTVDAYQYYGISLLNRINIDNTTQSGIYKNSNGFPVAVKSITIQSSDMKTYLQTDNQKSSVELEALDDLYPDELDQEYNTKAERNLIALKSDMKTGLEVE